MKKNTLTSVRFRAFYEDQSFIGEAILRITPGTHITDEFGYTDSDEIKVDLVTIFQEDDQYEVYPYRPGNNPLRIALEEAAIEEYFDPTSSLKIFPGEEESYFDGLVSLGKFDELGFAEAA